MKNKIFLSVCFFAIGLFGFSQNKITLEDIWLKFSFRPAPPPVYLFSDNGDYCITQDNEMNIVKADILTGKPTETIVNVSEVKGFNKNIDLNSFELSKMEKYLLITTNQEYSYRHSVSAKIFIWDLKNKKLFQLSNGDKIMFPKISPKENYITYVKNNNLFITELASQKETQVTKDGEWNKIKNGWADWVYEEEFSKADMFEWSDSENYLSYIKFDETNVKEFSMDMYNGKVYPDQYKFKYPKAGEENSIVSLHIYDLKNNKDIAVSISDNKDIYLPRIKWLHGQDVLCYTLLNRLQNHLQLLTYNLKNGEVKKILDEQSDTFIEINDYLTFINGNKNFIWLTNKDGYQHIYMYDMTGKQVQQITYGKFDVDKIVFINEKKKEIYFTSSEMGVINRPLIKINFDGKNKKVVHTGIGFQNADFSPNGTFFVLSKSTANEPSAYYLYQNDKLVKELESNAALKEKMKNYTLTQKEFYKFKTSEGIELDYWIMKPINFDSTKTYPVYMTAYNGPGINRVNNAFEYDYWFHQFLCQNGYIVACADGRGTFGKGKAFMHCTYLQLGKLETQDQIEFAKYLKTKRYVDTKNMAFQGWSYGGFMALNMITKGSEYIKAAIAVAPVSNWKFYDNIYTERYMRKPSENTAGYEDNSPIKYVKQIKGKLLLIHGAADDNVHLQNAMEFVNAAVNNNIPLDYFVYPNKNHGIFGGYTRLHLYNKIFGFLESNLKN